MEVDDIMLDREVDNEAVRRACELMPPNVLAELVDYWSDDQESMEFAQIAFNAGMRNCGLPGLLGYIANTNKIGLTRANVLYNWVTAGIKIL